MNYFSFFREATVLKKTFSIMTLLALLAGGLTGLVYTSTAYANNGINTYAVPNTGTLVPGQTMDVHMTVTLDPNDTNPVTSPSCLVNGVNVASTFTNLSSGSDGHFRFTYTVGESDASRAAGQVPISCTLSQTGSVTVTAFDDGNTVAIDTDSGNTGNPGDGLTAGSDGVITYFDPTSGTLTNGQSADLHLKVTLDPNDTNPVTSPQCYVNGVNVANTFQNLSSGTDGHFKVTYTVAAEHADRAAGQIPISCTLEQTGSLTIIELDDSNTLAIDATSSGGGNTNAPQISSVSIDPNSGTLTEGFGATVTFQTTDTATTDLVVSGLCHVNAVDVSSSFSHAGNGAYQFSYIVGPNDGERPAGHIPVSCTFSNSGGTVTATGWTDGNTVAIDTNGDGSIDNGTNTLGFTAVANPSSGTLEVGESVTVSIQDPLPSADVVIGSAGCRVNDKDVASSYSYQGNGLYQVTYTVASGDADRNAGEIPFDCTLENHTGSVHLIDFTDNNTLAIDATASGGGTGTTTPGEGLTAGSDGVITYFDPTSGTLNIGESADLHLKVTLDPNDTNPVTSPSCLVNGVNVASTFQNMTSGTNGHFMFTYTAASGHTNRSAGQIPISCTLQQTGSVTVTAFDDSNTLAVDVSGTGGTATTTGSFSSVVAVPNSGTLTAGQSLDIRMTVSDAHTGYTTATSCTANGVDVSNTFEHLGNGVYEVTYTVGANDTDRAAGTIPFMCTINKPSGVTASTTGFTDGNTVAIDANNNGTIGTSTIAFMSVTANPASGTLGASSTLQVNFQATSTATSLALGGACTVNNRDVSSTFQNLSGGLYRITYTVGSSDTERAAGTIPFSCILQSNGTATTTVSAFTTANTVAIDIDGNGTTTNPGGNNSGGNSTTTVALGPTPGVEPISMVESTATAGGGYEGGWVWIFRVTVPENETNLQMKFANWTSTSGTTTIATANNMRISSQQASSTSPVTIGAADSYSSPALVLTGDLDANTAGRQIEIRVEMQVPAGTVNGSYTTNYAIKSF